MNKSKLIYESFAEHPGVTTKEMLGILKKKHPRVAFTGALVQNVKAKFLSGKAPKYAYEPMPVGIVPGELERARADIVDINWDGSPRINPVVPPNGVAPLGILGNIQALKRAAQCLGGKEEAKKILDMVM